MKPQLYGTTQHNTSSRAPTTTKNTEVSHSNLPTIPITVAKSVIVSHNCHSFISRSSKLWDSIPFLLFFYFFFFHLFFSYFSQIKTLFPGNFVKPFSLHIALHLLLALYTALYQTVFIKISAFAFCQRCWDSWQIQRFGSDHLGGPDAKDFGSMENASEKGE